MKDTLIKTIGKTLIGTGIAAIFMTLPVRASENNLVARTTNEKLILSQFNYGTPQQYSEPTDDFKTIVGITGLAIGTGAIAYHLTKAYKPSLVNLPAIASNNTSLLARISPKLRQELLRLVHDRNTANRLLSGTSTSHPSRSPDWLAEKVIYDLKRDR